jgi:hypothetical protein
VVMGVGRCEVFSSLGNAIIPPGFRRPTPTTKALL